MSIQNLKSNYEKLIKIFPDYDWNSNYKKYKHLQKDNTLIKKHHDCQKKNESKIPVGNLSMEQQLCLCILDYHVENNIQLRLLVCGSPGTGKSEIIKHIQQKYNSKCITDGPTGKVANNNNGETAHSLFTIPVGAKKYLPLPDKTKKEKIQKLKNKTIRLEDEIYVFSKTHYFWINKRINQITNTKNIDGPFHTIRFVDVLVFTI